MWTHILLEFKPHMASKNLSEYQLDENIQTEDFRIAIVVSEWNAHITRRLLEGAKITLLNVGVLEKNICIDYVPGSFELIYASHKLAKGDVFDAVISIGSVIRGETAHFDYVCQAVSQGIKDINILTQTPCIFCVLTDDKESQAEERSGGVLGNKGVEAAVAAIRMADFTRKKI